MNGGFFMSENDAHKFTLNVNYNGDGASFQNILEKHIKNLIKTPLRDWNLQNIDIQYKQL